MMVLFGAEGNIYVVFEENIVLGVKLLYAVVFPPQAAFIGGEFSTFIDQSGIQYLPVYDL